MWPALHKWNINYISESLPSFKVHQSSFPEIQMLSLVQPFGQLEGPKWRRPWIEKQVEANHFFKGEEFLYFFSNLEDLPPALNHDIPDISFLSVGWRPVWETNLWMGVPPIRTPIHYDLLHNFYVQLHGNKRFILFPPTDYKYLYLYPRLHPSTRMSQVNLRNLQNYPDFYKSHPIEVVLSPGDVLYIPPYWFHDVTAVGVNVSMSVSIHTESDQSHIRDSMNNIVPVMRKFWKDTQKVDALAAFMEKLFKDKEDLLTFLEHFLESRYTPLKYDQSGKGGRSLFVFICDLSSGGACWGP
uniref:JmjC domain-containing protein n=1 Tax=Arcella intermedia TaxID=1963864 RepID=A0A6B2LAI5_9EUKA